MIRGPIQFAIIGCLSALLPIFGRVPAVAAEQVEVAEELAHLAETHGFALRGLEETSDALASVEGDALYPRLRRLLENFDHVIVQGPAGGVDSVIVLGEKDPLAAAAPLPLAAAPETEVGDEDIVIQTKRRGAQHLVQVSLQGADGARISRELQVDTGADYLVLPQSLISKLGVDQRSLDEQEMQTANGKAKARIGTLPILWLGDKQISDVQTAFLDDDKLGASGLLGMSVLGRYKLTIDEDANSITLGRKNGDREKTQAVAEAQGDADRGEGEGK